jgi:hypothetical protein
LIEYFDRPIAFHRIFVTLTGSVAAGLLLSQALYWSRRTTPLSGWFYKTQAEWEEETGLKRSEQETARKRLRQTTFWEEKRRGIPAKLYFRVDLAELERVLLQQPAPRPLRGKNPQSNHQSAGFQQTRMPTSRRLERQDPADQYANIPQTITETTAETLSESSPEININVGTNVGVKRRKPERQIRLTPRQEEALEELENQLDPNSRGAFAVIVSDRGVGEERALSLLQEAMEIEAAGRLKTTLSQCFMDLVFRDADRQGIDLGFQRAGPPSQETMQ